MMSILLLEFIITTKLLLNFSAIFAVIDSTGHKVQLAVVQYLFENGVEVLTVLPPHGN